MDEDEDEATREWTEAEVGRVSNDDIGKPPWWRRYSFILATGVLFLCSWAGQFSTQMMVILNEAEAHRQEFEWGDAWAQFFASTFENWQSEFLQLMWQAAGLAWFLHWRSSQSKETEERIEAKLDRLLWSRGIDPLDISRQVNEDA